MKVEVFIEGKRLDLFADETISVTQGVQDVKDISKLYADYSQSFNVPASNRNNAIFRNYYNQDINNGFDARTRKEGVITVNTIPFKVGKIQLDGVKIKENNPSSYKITFYGNIVNIKDRIGDDKLNTLDWLSNFDHDYTEAIVEQGLTSGLDFTVDGVDYDKAVVYPLISYKRRFIYNSDNSDHTNDEDIVNIRYHGGGGSHDPHGVKFENLKPAIKLYIILEAISKKYNLNFEGSIFNTLDFNAIYVNLNRDINSIGDGSVLVENRTVTIPPLAGYQVIINTRYLLTVTPDAGFEDVGYRTRITINGSVIHETPFLLEGVQDQFFTFEDYEIGDDIDIKFEVLCNQDFEFSATTNLIGGYYSYTQGFSYNTITPYPSSYTGLSIDLSTNILNEIKDIKTYDFLMGVFRTFNLVATSEDDKILIDDLQSWYSTGRIIDITKHVDTTTKQVDKGKIYNELFFEFKESEQILADEFNQSNARIYGNTDLTLYTDETETQKLDGTKLEVKSIFENPVFERLTDINNNDQTSILYCPYFNREIKGISGNPFMFYAAAVNVSNNSIGFVGTGNNYTELDDFVLMPSHTRQVGTTSLNTFNLNFAQEVNEYTGIEYTNTIYKKYYQDYISDIFSNKRRNYLFNAILPNSVLNNLKLNDRLVIGNTRYLINKVTSNLVNREDKLELINDIYSRPLVSDRLSTSLFLPSTGFYTRESGLFDTQYFGANGTASLVDLGSGTGWAKIENLTSGNDAILTFSLNANTDYQTYKDRVLADGGTFEDSGCLIGFIGFRSVGIKITDGQNNPTFTITQDY